jgi:hypothetical protein
MGNVIAGFVGGIVSYGIGHVESIAPWKVCNRTLVINPHLANHSHRQSSLSSGP